MHYTVEYIEPGSLLGLTPIYIAFFLFDFHFFLFSHFLFIHVFSIHFKNVPDF